MYEKKNRTLLVVLAVITVVLALAVGAMYLTLQKLQARLSEQSPEASVPTREDVLSNPAVATMTLSATGDILLAQPILDYCMMEDESYNFTHIFRYLAPYSRAAGISAINLVTTLGGEKSGGYTGLPKYNSPDSIVKALADAGFDAVLTANSHCYEDGLKGVKRTAEVLRRSYLFPIGTTYDKDKPTWKVLESNGIRVGLMCYTFESDDSYPAMPSINGQLFDRESIAYVDTFSSDNHDSFLIEAEERLALMKQAGAEVSVIFMHWGEEFSLEPTAEQKELSQKLCNMGFDVILGTHPHVVQPIHELTSEADPTHHAIVCYSLGNAVSNQRQGYGKPLTTAHTEDGVMLNLTFAKYADGSVYTEGVSALPYWLNLRSESEPATYTIVPLDPANRAGWKADYGLSSANLEQAEASFARTMAILNPALSTINNRLQNAAHNRAYTANLDE